MWSMNRCLTWVHKWIFQFFLPLQAWLVANMVGVLHPLIQVLHLWFSWFSKNDSRLCLTWMHIVTCITLQKGIKNAHVSHSLFRTCNFWTRPMLATTSYKHTYNHPRLICQVSGLFYSFWPNYPHFTHVFVIPCRTRSFQTNVINFLILRSIFFRLIMLRWGCSSRD